MENTILRNDAKSQGLSHYFTGQQCKHGHISKRNTKSGRCLECENARNAQYRQDNPAVAKKWRENNPNYASKKYHETKEVRKKQNKDWYEANKEQVLQYHKDWYYDPSNRDAIKESRKQWYEANPDYDAGYRKINKDKLQAEWHLNGENDIISNEDNNSKRNFKS